MKNLCLVVGSVREIEIDGALHLSIHFILARSGSESYIRSRCHTMTESMLQLTITLFDPELNDLELRESTQNLQTEFH